MEGFGSSCSIPLHCLQTQGWSCSVQTSWAMASAEEAPLDASWGLDFSCSPTKASLRGRLFCSITLHISSGLRMSKERTCGAASAQSWNPLLPPPHHSKQELISISFVSWEARKPLSLSPWKVFRQICPLLERNTLETSQVQLKCPWEVFLRSSKECVGQNTAEAFPLPSICQREQRFNLSWRLLGWCLGWAFVMPQSSR